MDSGDFTAFFRDVQPALVRYVTRMSDADTAQDVVSDTMATMWGKDLPAPTTEIEWRQTRSLAYRVAEGHLRNRRRGDRRRDALAQKIRLTTTPDSAVEPDLADGVFTGGEALDRLAALRPTDRDVIALVVDGFSLAEIAAILDCSVAAVKMRALRARKNLRTVLGREVHHVDE